VASSPGPTPPQAALPLTGPYEKVNALCDSFSSEWKPQSRPAFEDYLRQVAEDAQLTLLRNLLHIEIQRRRDCGEQPNAEEYLVKFPSLASLIRQVFFESSRALSTHQSVAAESEPAVVRSPAASRLGEYELLRELGRGGMGAVYEAIHTRQGNRVALKTLPQVDGSRLYQFKREFRALADVNHPNLIGLHTLESDGCHWFFTMDLIDGVDFLSHVRPGGVLDLSRLRPALAQLVTGVLALHARHIIHRDLKPSNVMVTSEGRVVVLDFGLVLEEDRSWSSDKIAGTPRYMAPEQATGNAITAASDWYAVGVILYEALAGRAPFLGSPLEVLQAKQRHDPPALQANSQTPEDLTALALRLLARAPDARPDARAIVKIIAAAVDTPQTAGPVSATQLVGREQQLGALQEAYRAVRKQRQPLTVFIRGRSGEGKTTLAEHFLEPLRRRTDEVAVMSGRCYDRESVPFKALDSLIDALGSYLRSLPGIEAALLLPDDMGLLMHVFPVLERVEVVAQAPRARATGLDEQQIRQRAFRALRELLWRISSRKPVLWCVDDLQWGDADSAEALFEVLRPPEAPAILFLGTYRSDEAEGSSFLRSWEELKRKHDIALERRELSIGPLSVAECTQLVISLLGEDSDNIRRRAVEFAAETGGNPLLLIELAGCFDAASDSVRALPMDEVIRQKLSRLPEDAPKLLDIIAVSGQAVAVTEASQAAGQTAPALATLTHMRNERLIRLLGTEDQPSVDTYHDRIRETVLGHLGEIPRRKLHRSLADAIEQNAGIDPDRLLATLECEDKQVGSKAIPRIYDLAYHSDAAGERQKALSYALLAAEQARRQSALEVAVNNYAIVKRNSDAASEATRFRIAEGRADALMLLGRYEDATAELNGVIDLVDDTERKARIEALLGEVATKQGLIDTSVTFYESALRRLGHWVPRTLLGLGYGLLREGLIQAWHSLRPRRLHRHQETTRLGLAVRFCSCLVNSYVFQSTPKVVWMHLLGMNQAERLPPSAQLAALYAHHACLLSMVVGWPARQIRYIQRATGLASQFDDLLTKGHCANYQGISLCASARYEEALTFLNESVVAFEKAGDVWQLHLAHFHKARCHYGLGNLAGAIAEARWTFSSSARLGDSRTLCSSYIWVRASSGRVAFEELRSCMPCRPDDIMSTVHGLLAEGFWHTFQGRTEQALAPFEQAVTIVRKSLCLNFHTAAAFPSLAGALRLHADNLQQTHAAQSTKLRRRAYRLAKWATRITRLFPTAYPHALRERALMLAAYGKTRKALKFADKSCAVAERQNAKYEYAQSFLVRAKLAKQLGLPEGDEQIRAAEASLEEIERPVREATNQGIAVP